MTGEKILIIDDELSVRQTFKDILESRGYIVDTSDTGKGGMDKVKQDVFDVILLDVCLPNEDGVQVLNEIKAIKQDLIVIMTSGFANIDAILTTETLGAYEYLTKPISPELLINTIIKAIEQRDTKTIKDPTPRM